MKFGQPVKITNSVGYNNQPAFLPDGSEILYTSIRDKQADIYRYNIRSGSATQITNTPESEFSPTLMPGGKFISVVRVEADGTQRLWKFPLAGGTPSLILEKIQPVGYHQISDKEWIIKAFDLRMRTSASLITTLPGVEDYAWMPSGLLLMAKDSKLFAVIPLQGKDWTELADFNSAGLKSITRITVNPKGNKIAIVAGH